MAHVESHMPNSKPEIDLLVGLMNVQYFNNFSLWTAIGSVSGSMENYGARKHAHNKVRDFGTQNTRWGWFLVIFDNFHQFSPRPMHGAEICVPIFFSCGQTP